MINRWMDGSYMDGWIVGQEFQTPRHLIKYRTTIRPLVVSSITTRTLPLRTGLYIECVGCRERGEEQTYEVLRVDHPRDINRSPCLDVVDPTLHGFMDTRHSRSLSLVPSYHPTWVLTTLRTLLLVCLPCTRQQYYVCS